MNHSEATAPLPPLLGEKSGRGRGGGGARYYDAEEVHE